MSGFEQIIRECVAESDSRYDLWVRFLNANRVEQAAEVGVYRGDFAAGILRGCESVQQYYMIDPWRHLEDWNKPANTSDEQFEQFLSETRAKTEFAAERRVILRGKTTEVIDKIPDGELDFCYIDGDHTLKGIAVDLIRVYPKIRSGGWIGGDDFSSTIWQHGTAFEPTLVFPFAVYFAEAVGARLYALPYGQFLLEKSAIPSFSFVDLVGRYEDTSLRRHLRPGRWLKSRIAETFPVTAKLVRRVKKSLAK